MLEWLIVNYLPFLVKKPGFWPGFFMLNIPTFMQDNCFSEKP